jgi:hypothetical protein
MKGSLFNFNCVYLFLFFLFLTFFNCQKPQECNLQLTKDKISMLQSDFIYDKGTVSEKWRQDAPSTGTDKDKDLDYFFMFEIHEKQDIYHLNKLV